MVGGDSADGLTFVYGLGPRFQVKVIAAAVHKLVGGVDAGDVASGPNQRRTRGTVPAVITWRRVKSVVLKVVFLGGNLSGVGIAVIPNEIF